MVYISEIAMALDDYSGFGSYVYDRETDRVEMLFDSTDPEVMDTQEAMEEDESGRFVSVYADSNLGYDAMVEFIQELPPQFTYLFFGTIFSFPPIYGLSTSGIRTEPSA